MSTYGNNKTLSQVPLEVTSPNINYLGVYEYQVPADCYFEPLSIFVVGTSASNITAVVNDSANGLIGTLAEFGQPMANFKGLRFHGGAKLKFTNGVAINANIKIYGTLFKNTP